jgi:DNA-binding PadR family transcriptional regulator
MSFDAGSPGAGVDQGTPLRPLDFAVLVVLSEGDHYGYGIVKAIAAREGGSVRLAPGNLYQVLDRLLAHGWIAEADRRQAGEGSKPRRFYRITPAGRRAAQGEGARLKGMIPRLKRLGLYS